MFSNLKLATLNWVFLLLGSMAIILILSSSFLIQKNIDVINNAWKLYQTDLSHKSQLERAVRSSIGYGGMIHNFKNYVLRHDDSYKKAAESQLNAAIAFLHQYKYLNLSSAEVSAIDDILDVLSHYKNSLHQVQDMIAQKYTISEIIDNVMIDDGPAVRGFKILRNEHISAWENTSKASKSHILADLRSALGYEGMIHIFKDYLLNHHNIHNEPNNQDQQLHKKIVTKIKQALVSIHQYQQLALSESEKLALYDIEKTINQYANHFPKIELLMAQKIPLKEIDNIIKVNDAKALRGFELLERQINLDITNQSETVSNTINNIIQTIEVSKWVLITAIFLVTLLTISIIRNYLIEPLLKLTKNMVRLAQNNLDTEIDENYAIIEINQMTRSVTVFKNSLIKLLKSEESTAKANKELHQQLEENNQLRNQSEKQTNKALLMAEKMAEARSSAEKAMARAEKDELFVSSILNAVRDGIITINAKGIIEDFNPGAEDIFGYKSYEVVGKNVSLLMPEPNRSAHDGYLNDFKLGKSSRDQSKPLEQLAIRKNGETFSAEVSLNTIKIGDEIKITGVLRDVTERKLKEAQIEKLAMTDSLTGLANRNQFNQRIEEMKNQAKRFKSIFCLMAIDLDKFKPVNDTYGHQIGDLVLQKVADILTENCRETDTIARLGGDEFSIILHAAEDPKELNVLAERIIEKLSGRLIIENHSIQIGASVGISCYPNNTTDTNELQKMADQALYLAKNEGRHTYRHYQLETIKSQ